MISEQILREQLKYTLDKTTFSFGKRYEGKVRDNFSVNGKRVIITTDRISAFDRVLCSLPFKGQVLNQTAEFWFEKTNHIIKNHVLEVPDPNVLVAVECELIPVEMVVRGYLTGTTKTSVLYNYNKGVRNYCGNNLPDGMKKDQAFEKPIITPTTKGIKGTHDELISKQDIVEKKLTDKKMYEQMERAALSLFTFGSEYVAKNNLILVDTKYEFGLLDGKLMLIDEMHTPDSSRFWVKDSYPNRFKKGEEPQKLDKEYVRQYLAERDFLGDGPIPEIPDDIKVEAARRYITAYEMITGKEFKADVGKVHSRIEANLRKVGLIGEKH